MFDEFGDLQFPTLRRWAWATDARHCEVDPPAEARRVLLAAAEHPADWLAPEVELTVRRRVRSTTLSGSSLADFVATTCRPLVDHLGATPATLTAEEAEAVRFACACLAVVASLQLDSSAAAPPEAADTDRDADILESASHLHDAIVRANNGIVRTAANGGFLFTLSAGDQEMLRTLAQETQTSISNDDDSVRRLFPPAYGGDDDDRNAGWDALAGSELRDRQSEALDELVTLIGQGRCTADQLHLVMRTLNAVRLRLGTQLGIETDDHAFSLRDHLRPDTIRYERLGRLLSEVIDALSADDPA